MNFSQSGITGIENSIPTIFEVPVEDSDSNYGRGQLGVSVLYPNESTLNISYSTTLGLSNIDYGYWSLSWRFAL